MWLLLFLLAFGEGIEPRLWERDSVLQQGSWPSTFSLGFSPPFTGVLGTFTTHRDTQLWTTSTLALSYARGPWRFLWEPMLKTGDDGVYPIQKFHDAFRSDFRRALIRWHPMESLWLAAGRAPLHFGESARFPLLFSEEAPPQEFVAWQFHKGPLEFHHALSQWPDIRARHTTFPGDTSPEVRAHRYMAFHGLSLSLGQRLRVGFSEAFTYGGDMTFQLLFANPFTLYYTNQFNHYPMANGNILWLFHGRWQPLQGWHLYGEFLVDDYQYAPSVNRETNHLGWLVGLEGARGAWAWHGEYTKITAWVYNHFYAYDRFEIYGIPVGHPFGPDLEMAWVRVQRHGKTFRWGGEFQWRVRGENRATTPWPVPEDPADSTAQFPQDNFLRGTPTKTVEATFLWGWRPWEGWEFCGRLGVLQTQRAGETEFSPVVEIQGFWRRDFR